MSTKPSSPASWDTTSTNLSAPTAGHKTSGFATDEVPTSAELNGQLKLLGDWTQYAYDGDISISGLTMKVAPHAIANATVNDWDPTGLAGVPDTNVIEITGGGASTVLTSLASAGAAQGRVVYLLNATGVVIYLTVASTTATAANRFVINDDFTADDKIRFPPNAVVGFFYNEPPTGSWVLFSASFPITPTQHFALDPSAAETVRTDLGSGLPFLASDGSGWGLSNTVQSVWYPIAVPAGKTIHSWSALFQKASNASGTLTAELYEVVLSTGVSTLIGATQSNSAVSPGHIALGQTIDCPTVAGRAYRVAVHQNTFVASDFSLGLTYDTY